MTHLRVYDHQLKKMLYDIRPDSLLAKVYCAKMFQNTKGLSNMVIQSMERYTFMPWIGINDRNGKPIYSEDTLIKYSPFGYQHTSQKRVVRFEIHSQSCGWNIGKGRDKINWEVIGNSLENINLIKKEDL